MWRQYVNTRMCQDVNLEPYHEHSLQARTVHELEEIFSTVTDVLEAAVAMSDPLKGRSHVIQELELLREGMRIPASNGRKSDGRRACFMNWGKWYRTFIHGNDVQFQLFPFFLSFCYHCFQECYRLYHCLQPNVTCFTGKKIILVKYSAWHWYYLFIYGNYQSSLLLSASWIQSPNLTQDKSKSYFQYLMYLSRFCVFFWILLTMIGVSTLMQMFWTPFWIMTLTNWWLTGNLRRKRM